MRAVQFDQVEPGPLGSQRRGHELGLDLIQLGRRQLVRHLADPSEVRDRRRTADWPVAVIERGVHAVPHELGRSLAAGVPQL